MSQITSYGKKTFTDKIKDLFYRRSIEISCKLETYGRTIEVTTGMIKGFIIDTLIPGTGGLPIFLLKRYGKVIKIIRFNKTFNKYVEFLISNLVTKKQKVSF